MSDTQDFVRCPACGKEMVKIFANKTAYIDICLDGCGGLFFDNGELEKFNQPNKKIDDILYFYEGNVKFEKPSKNKQRICACGAYMNEINYGETKIDACSLCKAKFLDAFELQQIRDSYKTKKGFSDKLILQFANDLEQKRKLAIQNGEEFSIIKAFIEYYSESEK